MLTIELATHKTLSRAATATILVRCPLRGGFYIKLGEIIKHFPVLQPEYDSILSHLQQLSEESNWWKDERNVEIHLDMEQLYKTRHEEINESKVVMESNQILMLCNRVNYLVLMMTGAHIKYMEKHLKMDR